MSNDGVFDQPTYTDGTFVKAGDNIRYKQAPGGMLPPSKDWTYGVAVPIPETHRTTLDGPNALVMEYMPGRYNNLFSHIIERV